MNLWIQGNTSNLYKQKLCNPIYKVRHKIMEVTGEIGGAIPLVAAYICNIEPYTFS